jgi:hypothetical protein
VFCSFLALVLKAELDARIAALGHNGSCPACVFRRKSAMHSGVMSASDSDLMSAVPI